MLQILSFEKSLSILVHIWTKISTFQLLISFPAAYYPNAQEISIALDSFAILFF